MSRRDALAEGVLACKPLVLRYLKGFDESNYLAQAPSLPNHIGWTLGHLSQTMFRVAERMDGQALPEEYFIRGGVACDASRFGTEAVCVGSPAPRPGDPYPPLARCIEVFSAACDRLASAVRSADEHLLDRLTPWGPAEMPMHLLVQRMIFHNGTHQGQIADLRRALNMERIIKM
jgi:hypothetical protein